MDDAASSKRRFQHETCCLASICLVEFSFCSPCGPSWKRQTDVPVAVIQSCLECAQWKRQTDNRCLWSWAFVAFGPWPLWPSNCAFGPFGLFALLALWAFPWPFVPFGLALWVLAFGPLALGPLSFALSLLWPLAMPLSLGPWALGFGLWPLVFGLGLLLFASFSILQPFTLAFASLLALELRPRWSSSSSSSSSSSFSSSSSSSSSFFSLMMKHCASKAAFSLASSFAHHWSWEEAAWDPEAWDRRSEAGGRWPKGEGWRAQAEGCGGVLFASKSGAVMQWFTTSAKQSGGWSLLWMHLSRACLQSDVFAAESLMRVERLCHFTHRALRIAPHLSSTVFESAPQSSAAQRQTASLIDPPRAIHVPSCWCQAWGLSYHLCSMPSGPPSSSKTHSLLFRLARSDQPYQTCLRSPPCKDPMQCLLTACGSRLWAQCWQCQSLEGWHALLLRWTLSAHEWNEWRWTRGQLPTFFGLGHRFVTLLIFQC